MSAGQQVSQERPEDFRVRNSLVGFESNSTEVEIGLVGKVCLLPVAGVVALVWQWLRPQWLRLNLEALRLRSTDMRWARQVSNSQRRRVASTQHRW